MRTCSRLLCMLLAFLFSHATLVSASHILGGGLTYKCVGLSGMLYRYHVTLVIYEDCRTGQPAAIEQDNPAFLGIYRTGDSYPFYIDTAVYYSSSVVVNFHLHTSCGVIPAPDSLFCCIKKTFEAEYMLSASSAGYTIAYQRCCRSAQIANLVDPGDEGTTYFCSIPPGIPSNSSPVFTSDPPFAGCVLEMANYPMNATDPDGDSLTYSFDTCYTGGASTNVRPLPAAPPYSPVSYMAGYSVTNPMGPSGTAAYDATTGMMWLKPGALAFYVVGIACHEWRGGVMINTTHLEFNMMSIDCTGLAFHANAGADTMVHPGDTVQFNASEAASYSWSPDTHLNDGTIRNPMGIFPDLGTYTYVLSEVSDSGCTSTDTVNVFVVNHVPPAIMLPNAFTPNGDQINDVLLPVDVMTATLKKFAVFDWMGTKVYETSVKNNGWDGTFGGHPAKEGVYFWELRYINGKGEQVRQTGNVTLLR